MKLLIAILLLSFTAKGDIFPLDKIAHMTVCYGIGVTTNIIAKDKLNDKALFTTTFAIPMTIGISKEAYDYLRGGKFDLMDIKADFIGALASALVCKVIKNFKEKKKGQILFFGATDEERLERNKNKIDWENINN